jgi:RHS repeat-associated protein
VPKTSITSKYSWLGADQLPTELPTGVINMGARAYIPQLGRFEQTDPQPGGSINAYAYTDDDPINQADPTGETATYNFEDVETGSAAPGLPETYGVPGAIKPPPANLQAEAEFAADPPWDAASEEVSVLGYWDQSTSGEEAIAAAPCAHHETNTNYCGPQLPGRALCENPLQQGCRVTNQAPTGDGKEGRLAVVNTHKVGPYVGCIIGGVIGAAFAESTTVGLADEAGATGGCFVTAGLVIIVEDIF